jgi:hypothetical protein
MPELYGNPYKWELRKQIRELSTALWDERKAHRDMRHSLTYARCKIEELEAKIRSIEQKAQELLAQTTQDIEASTDERFSQALRKRYAA